MKTENETRTVRLGTKLGYGIGNIAYSLPNQLIASSFILFATAILKMPAALAGVIMAVAAIWDGLSDPVMGCLSDNTESRRFGRRHQYILGGTVLLAIITYSLWSLNPAGKLAANFWVILCLVLVAKTALTIFVVPYNALGGELSTGYYERSSIQSYRAVFYLLGMLIALVSSNMYFFRSTPDYPKGQLNPAAYPAMGATFAGIILLVGLLSYFSTKKIIPQLPQRTPTMRDQGMSLNVITKDVLAALKNSDLRAMVLMIFFIEVGLQMTVSLGFHINTYTYNLNGPIMGLLALILLLFSIVSQPFWIKMTKLIGKKKALIAAMFIGVGGFVFSPWVHVWLHLFPTDDPKSLIVSLGFFNVLAGIGNGAFMSIPFSMVADAVDDQEVKTGQRDEGLFFGLYTFAYKLGTSVSMVLTGIVIAYARFNPDLKVQSDFTQFNLAMMPSYFLLLIAPMTLWIFGKYSITPEKYRLIRKQLEETRKN